MITLSSIWLSYAPFSTLKIMYEFAYTTNIFKVNWLIALKLSAFVHIHYHKDWLSNDNSIQHLTKLCPFSSWKALKYNEMHVGVSIPPHIFSKSIDQLLWNFTHLFTIMLPPKNQDLITFSFIFDLSLSPFRLIMYEFAYHLKCF